MIYTNQALEQNFLLLERVYIGTFFTVFQIDGYYKKVHRAISRDHPTHPKYYTSLAEFINLQIMYLQKVPLLLVNEFA